MCVHLGDSCGWSSLGDLYTCQVQEMFLSSYSYSANFLMLTPALLNQLAILDLLSVSRAMAGSISVLGLAPCAFIFVSATELIKYIPDFTGMCLQDLLVSGALSFLPMGSRLVGYAMAPSCTVSHPLYPVGHEQETFPGQLSHTPYWIAYFMR